MERGPVFFCPPSSVFLAMAGFQSHIMAIAEKDGTLIGQVIAFSDYILPTAQCTLATTIISANAREARNLVLDLLLYVACPTYNKLWNISG